MADNDTFLANERVGSSSTALLPVNGAENTNGEWSSAPAAMVSTGSDLMVYVHAIRRHWLMAASIGVLCAAIAGPAVWYGVGAMYTATSYLKVQMQEKPILADRDTGGIIDRDRFEIYKNTQQQLLLSRFVLIAALRKPVVGKLPVIQNETDPVDWLANRISVSFPGKAELMEVSLTRADKDEAMVLVNAVVRAYLDEVVNVEQNLKRIRLTELDRAFVEKETDVRAKRDDLKTMAAGLGTSDTETLTLKQKLALEELTIYRQEMAKMQFELRKLQTDLAAQHAVLDGLKTLDPNDSEVVMLVQNDPIARQLSMDLGYLKLNETYTKGAVVPGAQSKYTSRFSQELQAMQQQFDAKREEFAAMVLQKKRSFVEMDIRRLETAEKVTKAQSEMVKDQVAGLLEDAKKFGNSTVDLEMMRAEIKNGELMLTGISGEREKLRVEIRSAARVNLLLQAEKPTKSSNDNSRLALSLMTMMVSLCFPAGIVALWDSRAKRINTCNDVSKGLRLPVIGAVPLIPARVLGQLGAPSKRNQSWHMRLTESVDGIAARVLRKADTEQCRVILVSSATSGEGKTTLATQLALSLSRAGRRTVLVDFDLRRPAFDEVFGLPLEPGVCEALREQNDITALVHEIPDSNLSVVTAGRWDRSALAALSNGSAAAMFKELRQDYEFVVVDSSPILPVADARFVSQHVDSVVLSVFRDISQAPKIQAACEILAAFGVQTVEAVVTGPNDNVYDRHMGYESTIPA
jgi:polysaccharide biosynthesis transport protein